MGVGVLAGVLALAAPSSPSHRAVSRTASGTSSPGRSRSSLLGALPRRSLPGRARRRDALRARFPEPARHGDGGHRLLLTVLQLAALTWTWLRRPGEPEGSSAERDRTRRGRGAREGALTAVSRLARAGGAARRGRRVSAALARRQSSSGSRIAGQILATSSSCRRSSCSRATCFSSGRSSTPSEREHGAARSL